VHSLRFKMAHDRFYPKCQKVSETNEKGHSLRVYIFLAFAQKKESFCVWCNNWINSCPTHSVFCLIVLIICELMYVCLLLFCFVFIFVSGSHCVYIFVVDEFHAHKNGVRWLP
jgi:hypothetical protein